MRTFYKTFTRLTAAALVVAMSATPGFAAKTTPATDKNTNVPAVPRAIPDLVPYHNFDPPKGVFDASKLTISGDMRVRPEFRTNGNFGTEKNNAFFTQQFIRLGFNYDISPDVAFFVQPQVSNNWGAGSGGGEFGNPNGTSTNLFLRQGYMLVRNFLMPNLTLKAGRQLMVWGNHRMFGHFDWNNVAFSFDGLTMRYNHETMPVELGWLRTGEGNCGPNGGGCANTGATAEANASKGDSDILFLRMPMKFGSLVVEPAYIFEDGGTGPNRQNGSDIVGGQQPNQKRSTLGARVAFKQGMFDATGEGYYQFGTMDQAGQADRVHINALAAHLDAGVTLPVPMQPRIGAEINYASGDGDNAKCNAGGKGNVSGCNGNNNTFSQLYPTNHIHFGYMDLMSWQNMLTYGGNLQMRPTAESHFEIGGHIMRLANQGDYWYQAGQTAFSTKASLANNKEKSLGGEIDVVYTLFFQNNKVGWQLGYGHFFTGDYLKKNGFGTADQNWGYTQLWVNF